jgi:hypothetical protein
MKSSSAGKELARMDVSWERKESGGNESQGKNHVVSPLHASAHLTKPHACNSGWLGDDDPENPRPTPLLAVQRPSLPAGLPLNRARTN